MPADTMKLSAPENKDGRVQVDQGPIAPPNEWSVPKSQAPEHGSPSFEMPQADQPVHVSEPRGLPSQPCVGQPGPRGNIYDPY